MWKSPLIPLRTSLSWLVPEDQDDMIAETDFRLLFFDYAKQLDSQEVFKAINFFFISDSD